jgi:hypothetical protein
MFSLRGAALRVALAGVLLTTPGRADDREAAAAIERGIALRRKHMDVEALADFRHAYALEPTPRALAQLALAEGALARWVPAEGDLLRALAAEDEWIDRQRGTLLVALKEIQSHLSTLEIAGPEHAEVWIDGVLVAQLPAQPLRVPAEHITVELRAPGFEPGRREVDAQAGAITRATIALNAPQVGAPRQALQVAPAGSEPLYHGRPLQRTLAWAGAGAALAFLGGGVAFTLYAADRSSLYNSEPDCLQPTRPANCRLYASRLDTAEVLEGVAYSAAGLAAIASAVLFLTLPSSTSTRSAQARVWCMPTFGGAVCGSTY